MARLEYRNVDAPNLTGVSAILENAGRSFDKGLESASGMLAKYKEGQEEKNDNLILGDIAKLSSEQELDAYLNSGELEGKQLSSTMRETILKLRQGILDGNQTRANTGLTTANTGQVQANTRSIDANTAINQAVEGRRVSEYQDSVEARDELRGLTGLAVAADIEGNRYGRGVAVLETPRAKEISAKLEARGLPLVVAQGLTVNLADESQFNTSVNEKNPIVAGSRGGFGIGQWTGVRREALEAEAKRLGVDPSNEDFQLDYLVQELGTTEAGALNEALSTNDIGQASDVLLKRFFRPSPENIAKRSASYLSGSATRTGSANAALAEAVAKSVKLNPTEALALIQQGRDAQIAGEKQIASDRAKSVAELSAQTQLNAAVNPEYNPTNVNDRVLKDTGNLGLTPTERLSVLGDTAAAIGEGGVLSPIFVPGIPAGATQDIDTASKFYLGQKQRELESSKTGRILARGERYGEDPVKGLVEELGIGADGENSSEWLFGLFGENPDENLIRSKINYIADKAGVTDSVAAGALAEIFQRDPFGTNTVNRKFDEKEVIEFIKANTGPEARDSYEIEKTNMDRDIAQLEGLRLQYSTALRQGVKERNANGKISVATSNLINSLDKEIKQYAQNSNK